MKTRRLKNKFDQVVFDLAGTKQKIVDVILVCINSNGITGKTKDKREPVFYVTGTTNQWLLK